MAHPQTNGQVESESKTILNGIKKKLEGSRRNWVEELLGVLWASRTTVKEATSHTPFSLVFGAEAVLPVEVGIPSTRVTYYDQYNNDQDKPIKLDLLPEMRGNALLKALAQQQRMTRQFNKLVKPRQFQVGDLVLRKVEATSKIVEKGKLGRNWDRPFKVTRIIRLGTYELEHNEKVLPRSWNPDHLKKFYV